MSSNNSMCVCVLSMCVLSVCVCMCVCRDIPGGGFQRNQETLLDFMQYLKH